MTTINDIHDLVELLQNHPDWAETLRNLILIRELLDLPQTLAPRPYRTGPRPTRP